MHGNNLNVHQQINGWGRCGVCVYISLSLYIYIYRYTHTHTHNGILLTHQKECNNAICSNMDATRYYHIKWSKSDRERQISYDITRMWNLKYDTNELVLQNRLTDINNRLVVDKGKAWGRDGLEVWG